MNEWWDGLQAMEKFFYYIAVPSTVVLVIQFILSLIGFDSDMDMDMDMDVDTDFDLDLDEASDGEALGADLKFISFRGIIAFLTIFSWTGIILYSKNIPIPFVILVSTVAGFVAMAVVAYLFFAISKLQSSGNIEYRNAIGVTGEVYIPIPAKGNGMGKVQVIIQERLVEADAVSHDESSFSTGQRIRVVDVIGKTTLVVECDK